MYLLNSLWHQMFWLWQMKTTNDVYFQSCQSMFLFMLFSKCTLADVLESQGTSCKHWLNQLLKLLAKMINFVILESMQILLYNYPILLNFNKFTCINLIKFIIIKSQTILMFCGKWSKYDFDHSSTLDFGPL